ncbi:hypothetical protein LIER_39166 [Lithospermum erythrorhizon]|uniref:Uncharacterized protein n=1 Tax=Lithospermum erythrorhizon TaxID=34254 RepID=A0AAV3QBG0_LITER
MASFYTLHGESGAFLSIGTRDSKDTTVLPVHASLYKGMSIDWDSVPDSEVGGRMDWSPYASGPCYCLTSRGNPDPKIPRSLRYLKDEIAAGRVAWDGPIEVLGTFGYTPGYWEWAEDILSRCSSVLSTAHLEKGIQASLYVYDCSDAMLKVFCEYLNPSTNSLLTGVGELSISLWDLYKLGGLSITGQIFDEVVPSAECLSLAFSAKDRIPKSCAFLLQAYHHLSSSSVDGLVLITDCINLWSESPRIYVGPQAIGSGGGKASSLAGCPKGTISPHRHWDS